MFALQFWLQQSRRASFRILVCALVLAVAAISSVGVFSARLDAALMRDANQMLGGDLVIESRQAPHNADWKTLLQEIEFSAIKIAESVVFTSVLPSEKTDLLVSVKAVSQTYPLVGQMVLKNAKGQEERLTSGPQSGVAWVDQSVMGSLNINIGDFISLGQQRFQVQKTILIEPDRGPGFMNFAPRVMITLENLNSTGLIGPGSRVRWNTYLMGEDTIIERFKLAVQPKLLPNEEIETLENDRPEVSASLARAQNILAMSALVGTLVACIGIALVSHLFSQEQSRELAILKSLGYSPRYLTKIWLIGLAGLTFSAGLMGVGLGWLAHWVLLALLADLLGVNLPFAGLYFLPFGVFLAGLFLIGFAVVPAYFSLQQPASAVIRQHDLSSNRKLTLFSIVFAIIAALLISFLVVKDSLLVLLLCGGFIVVSFVFAGLFWLLLKALAVFEHIFQVRTTQITVFQNMFRRAPSLVIQGVSLSLGLSALFVLAVIQGDLVQRWQTMLPVNTPNRFVFNIQPDQVQGVRDSVATMTSQPLDMFPMVRGRLVKINGKKIQADSYDNPRAQRLVEREFNISFTNILPSNNQLDRGQWFRSDAQRFEVSIESGVAQRLGLSIGDWLTFDFAGQAIQAELTNTRSLNWDSMEVNFVVIFPPHVLQNFPQTWITALYAEEPTISEKSRQLVRQFPNITILDVGLVIQQLKAILNQVGQAVQFIFLFTLISGGLVVMACILSSARTRTRESAILRTLGASSRQLIRAAWLELTVLGGLAGLVAAIAAQVLGWAIAAFVFDFSYVLSISSVITGLVLGILVSVLFGAWSIRRVCLTPVMQTLRNTPI